ncbi:hypothetical protein SDC9_89688 [bioreactor metagenome]|uniref:Uncharacterized protein n=1 Tax=bioreactor metagenome TaxID=1076179 RepID=A0A644ZQH7_9ZZZZ
MQAERVAHEARQDDRAQVAAAIGRQGLLATRIGGLDVLGVVQIVVGVDLVEEQNARLGEVVGRLHDGVPQLSRGQRAVHPLAIGTLARARLLDVLAGFGHMDQLPVAIGLHGLHEAVGHADRHVEIVPAARRALGGDEVQHIRMINAQHAHLRAATCPSALYGGARLIEHVDVAAGARGHRGRALDQRAARADAREVVAHAAATAHGFRRLAQRLVDAREARIIHALDAIAHGLHKAVDQRGLDVCARRAHDAAGADGTCAQIVHEARLYRLAQLLALHRCQRARHAAIEFFHVLLIIFEVFLAQHVETDGLHGQGGNQIGSFAFHENVYSAELGLKKT